MKIRIAERAAEASVVLLVAALLLGSACSGTAATGQRDAAQSLSDAAGMDARVVDAVAPDAEPTDAGGGPEPELRQPCVNGACWETRAPALRCGTFLLGEDYSSGDYNVHRYATTIWGGVEATMEVVRTGGTFQPAIIVKAEDGTVLFDGEVGRVTTGLTVTPQLHGRTGDTARISIVSDTTISVYVFVTGWSVVDSDFVDSLGQSVTYDLRLEPTCAHATSVPCVVNGHTVAEPGCRWLHYLALEIVPLLQGTREERVNDAAVVGWWSLKEGVLWVTNTLAYSNCADTGANVHIGPLESCNPGYAWQVGVSAVQVPWHTLTELQNAAAALYPGQTTDQILETTARAAGLIGTEVNAVVTSTGDFHRSWLLRNSAIGVTVQVITVTAECIDGSDYWCYGTGYTSTALFSPDKPTALVAIEDVRAIIDSVAP